MPKRLICSLLTILTFGMVFTPRLWGEEINLNQVGVFANDKAGKPYMVLGEITAKATQDENCVQKLQKKTLLNGGNVIVDYSSGATGTHGAWTGAAVIICKGIAARWAKEGENGQTSIDPNAPMPVLTKK